MQSLSSQKPFRNNKVKKNHTKEQKNTLFMDKYEENMAQFLQCTSVPLIQPQDHNPHRAFLLSDEDKSPNSEVESTTKSLSKANSTVSSVVFHGLVCFEAIEAQKSHSNSLN